MLATIERKVIIDIDIDIEILFFVEYSQTCNISPVGLLFRQTRVKQHAKISQHAIKKNKKKAKNNTYNEQIKRKNTEYEVYHSMQILYIKICLF